jgi:hypothetical protein
MASVVVTTIEDLLAKLLSSPGALGSLGRGVVAGIGAFAVSDILRALTSNPGAKSVIPKYALVDLHNNTVVMFLSKRRAYRFLLRPRGRSKGRKTVVIREIERERSSV